MANRGSPRPVMVDGELYATMRGAGRAIFEGTEETDERGARSIFKGVWDEANAKRGLGWDATPWVWAIGFERTETE